MNKIKRNHKDSVHVFGVEQLPDEYEVSLGLQFDVEEWDASCFSLMTNDVRIVIRLDGGVEIYFVDRFASAETYELHDWFVDNELEWSSSKSWFDDDDYPNLVTPSFPERLAGAIEICRLLLDVNFHDEWNFSVGTELKGGNEYSYMPLHEYIHPAYIRGI